MKLLCITDPKTHPEFDTTVELYNVFAKDSEIELFHTSAIGISSSSSISVVPVTESLSYQEFLALDKAQGEEAEIGSFDLVFCRTDKPRPDNYHDNLGGFEGKVRFVNSPSALDKVFLPAFIDQVWRDYLPAHIFSRDLEEIKSFFGLHGVMVAKQHGSYGGKGVFKIWQEGEEFLFDNTVLGTDKFPTLDLLLEKLLSFDSGTYQFARFLNNINEGDKRVLVVDGEIYGGYLRKSSSANWVHNITSGGQAFAAEVTNKEKEVISATCRAFHHLGIHTLGYDFLMDDDGSWVLSEINAGNIGGYGRLEKLSGAPIYQRLISWLKAFAARSQ